MSKDMRRVVRVCGWLLLGFGVFSLAGRDGADTLADKASIGVALFLAHLGLLARVEPARNGTSGWGRAAARIALGLVGGVIGGYFLWNALQYAAVALHGGRFDLAASWGALLLAGGLGYLIASPPRTAVAK